MAYLVRQLCYPATLCASLCIVATTPAADSATSPLIVPHERQEAQAKAQPERSFDPLAHDNEYDSLFESDLFTIRSVIGTYAATAPVDPSERISFYLANIDRTTQAFYSPDGYAISPVSLGILKMGDAVRPWVRQAFSYAAATPVQHRKARFLACLAGRFHDQDAFDTLAVAAMQHPSPDVRASSCWALARCGGTRAIPFLVELLYTSETMGDTRTLPLGAAEALRVVTGLSFPKVTTSEARPDTVVVWQDPARWRDWAGRYRAGGRRARYEPAVEDALQNRRALRLLAESDS